MNKLKLKDIAILQTGPFGTQFKASEYTEEGIPVLNVKNIGYGNIVENNLDHISEKTKMRLSEHVVFTNDIVFGRKGSVDRHAFISEKYSGWFQGSDCIRVRIQNTDINAKYVSYYLRLSNVKKQIVSASVGSTMDSLNTTILKEIVVSVPGIKQQNKIAEILTLLEDKIENNNKINAELESMAKTIYDYRFLQFEFPNEEGKPYKSSGGKMVWAEEMKIEIPEGWKVCALKELFGFVKGKIPKSISESNDEYYNTPYLTIDALLNGAKSYCNDKNTVLTNNDVLMVVDGAASSEVYLGYKGAIGSTFCKLTLNTDRISSELLYLCMKKHEDVFKKVNTGSTVPHANKNYIGDYKIALPSNEMILDDIQGPLLNYMCKIISNRKENQELASLRDFLLPLLMNGQVGFEEV